MSSRSLSFDVVVIGGGLAGMMAALGARLRGAEVAVLAEGGGALELSSGCIDLCNGPTEQLPAVHPYRMIGADAVREALSAFLDVTRKMELPYVEPSDRRNVQTVTAVGTLRPTYLAAPGAAMVAPGAAIRMVGFRGMKEFHPDVVADGLRRAVPGVTVTAEWAELPSGTAHPLQVARALEEPAHRTRLAAALEHGHESLLFPAVLGLDGAEGVRSDLSAALGAPVSEVPLLSPSLPGLRLATRLSRHLQRLGVQLCWGAHATHATPDGTITARAASGAVTYKAGAVVLATGGLLGRGLEVNDRTLVEPVFGLPVSRPEGAWAGRELLAPAGHAFIRAGIRTDANLRPDGRRNLYVAGKALAGYDPYAEGSGGGVAIATGWRAGTLAGGGK